MLNNNFLAKSVRYALIGGAAAAAFSASVVAEEKNDNVERISVTGSAIKRTDFEGALPVTVITSEEIAKTGVTSTADLIQQLPAMQGFTTSADSVGGAGGGIQTANIHNLGDQYTLVLVNSRRLAPSDSGSTVDISSIPVGAIERVEVLTDGASALYGSDAIAGVVNFIMKKNYQGLEVSARHDVPESTGGEKTTFNITGGFGDFDADGYNIMASVSFSSVEQLAAKDRSFASSGIITFEDQGRDLYFFNGSPNAIPANARVSYDTGEVDKDGKAVYSDKRVFNPYASANGKCAEFTSPIGNECWFDYTQTIEIVPESERTSAYISGEFAVNDDLKVFSEVSLNKYETTNRIAPYPTGYFDLPSTSQLVLDNIVPYLTEAEKAAYDANPSSLKAQARWRAWPGDNRTTEYDVTTSQIILGLEGVAGEIDYSGAITYATNDTDQNYPSGWLLSDEFVAAVSAGEIDVFATNDSIDQASVDKLNSVQYSGNWDTTKIKVAGFDFKGSMPVFELSGGEAYLAAGVDLRHTQYTKVNSKAQDDAIILFLSAGDSYDLERLNYGVFTELQVPFSDSLLATASVRYDAINAVEDKLNSIDVGEDESDVTYKLSLRYQATDDLLLRASYGTGFKAPSMREIAQPRAEAGVTSGNYSCPFSSGDPLAKYCLSGKTQYSVFSQGFAGLKPEKSEQYTVGFVYAPNNEFSFGLDYWGVNLEDVVTEIQEQQVFGDASRYRDLFTTKTNKATGDEELAYIESSINLAENINRGIDWHVNRDIDLGWGTLKNSFTGTYMIRADRSVPGKPGQLTNSLGQFGDNNAVTFRIISQLSTTLAHGDFEHTLVANYKSGYRDQLKTAEDCAVEYLNPTDPNDPCVDVQLRIPSYTTVNYRTEWHTTDNFKLTVGVTNLFDKEPSLSLRTSGAGHQVGFDPRYTDPYGRNFYIQGDYKF